MARLLTKLRRTPLLTLPGLLRAPGALLTTGANLMTLLLIAAAAAPDVTAMVC